MQPNESDVNESDVPDTEHIAPPASAPAPAPVPVPVPGANFSKRDLTVGLVSLGIGLIVGVGGTFSVTSLTTGAGSFFASTAIADATETCDVASSSYITVGDGGQSLAMQSEGEEALGAEYADIVCVLDQLDVSDSVTNRISSTRALDGRQSAAWDDYSASWGYHPDHGLDMVIEISQE